MLKEVASPYLLQISLEVTIIYRRNPRIEHDHTCLSQCGTEVRYVYLRLILFKATILSNTKFQINYYYQQGVFINNIVRLIGIGTYDFIQNL